MKENSKQIETAKTETVTRPVGPGADGSAAAPRPADGAENPDSVQSPAAPVLCIENLSKIYGAQRTARRASRRAKEGAAGPVQALDGVSFTLTPGLYGLLGPNGAGKSTLINIITGSLLPSAGRVTWCGADTRALGIRFRRLLGYMPQQQGLYDRYSGRNFLLYMAALKEVPRAGAPPPSRPWPPPSIWPTSWKSGFPPTAAA